MPAQYSDAELVEVISSTRIVFESFKMLNTAKYVQFILNEVSRPEIIRSYLNTTFRGLQFVSERDFGNTGYRRRIIRYLRMRMKSALMTNIDKVSEMNMNEQVQDGIYDRMNANKIFSTLQKILINGSITKYEKLLGLSYAYAAVVEGVYKKSIQMCYLWERMGTYSLQDDMFSTINEMDIHKIRGYYKRCFVDEAIFDGYNNTIRNAIAHSTIYFNNETNEMLYRDKRSGKEKSLDVDGLYALYEKIWAVYLMILLEDQILRIHDACVNLVERRGSIRFR